MKLFTIALSALALCGAAIAAPVDTLTARFSAPVMVGDKALPAGEVTFNVIHGSSSMLLVARTANNEAAAVMVTRQYEPDVAGKSEVILNKAGSTLKVDKVTIEGITYLVVDSQ